VDEALALGKPVIALTTEVRSGLAGTKASSVVAALDVDQATRVAQSLASAAREEVKPRDVVDSAAALRVARLSKQWLRERQRASHPGVEALR
jgi:hypothetical protein